MLLTMAHVFRSWEELARKVAIVVNANAKGATGSITLTANSATSTLTDNRITTNSHIGFMPTTSNAAAEIGNGTMYVSSRSTGSATITHANNAQTDRTFIYSVEG
jgi:hypothetical protein